MNQRTIRPGQITLLLAIALVHVAAWFAYYAELPAGQYPTDEARATLDAARAISASQPGAEGSGAGNSLYTYVVSLLARFADTDGGITAAARVLNALALLWITGVCASATSHYWQSNRAVWITGLLIGLNPVLVFWAGEISPALLAAACMGSAVAYLLPWFKDTKMRNSLIIAASLTIASALQTALSPFALLWPLFAFFYPIHRKTTHFSLAILPPALLFGLVLLTNLSLQPPWQWAAGPIAQEARSAYAALASQESPQGKNFALYRELHLLLFLNPIHWGLLFMLAGAGFYVRLKERPWSPTVLVAIMTLVLFALSFALSDGGSQTRASMIPLVAVFAAGAYQIPRLWHRSGHSRRLKLIAMGLLMVVFSYATSFTGGQSKNWEDDYVYLARANLAMEHNKRATTWANKALKLNPDRLDMQEVLVRAQFNDWALSNQPRTLPSETAREYLMTTEPVQQQSTLRTIRAIYQYKLRKTEEAVAGWQAEKQTCPLAMLCLYWTGETQQISSSDLDKYLGRPYYDLLVQAFKVDRNALEYGELEQQIDNLLALAY